MESLHQVRTESASKRNLTIKQVKSMLKRDKSLVHRLQQKLKSLRTKKQNRNIKAPNAIELLNIIEDMGVFTGGKQTRRRKATRGRPSKRA